MTPNAHQHPTTWKSPFPLLQRQHSGGPLAGLFGLLWAWHEASRQRHHLAQLDDRALKDIGIARSEAGSEPGVVFWRM